MGALCSSRQFEFVASERIEEYAYLRPEEVARNIIGGWSMHHAFPPTTTTMLH